MKLEASWDESGQKADSILWSSQKRRQYRNCVIHYQVFIYRQAHHNIPHSAHLHAIIIRLWVIKEEQIFFDSKNPSFHFHPVGRPAWVKGCWDTVAFRQFRKHTSLPPLGIPFLSNPLISKLFHLFKRIQVSCSLALNLFFSFPALSCYRLSYHTLLGAVRVILTLHLISHQYSPSLKTGP